MACGVVITSEPTAVTSGSSAAHSFETVFDWKIYSDAKKEAANAPSRVVNTLICIFMPERKYV